MLSLTSNCLLKYYMTLIFVYLSLSLGISFLCSILEAVLLSTPQSYISVKLAEGVKSASKLEKLKANIDRPISAILSLNTVAHTVGAAGVGAEASAYFGAEYFGVISAVLTILILLLSEIIPKTIGATYWKRLIFPSVKIINIMIIILYPLVWISELITKMVASKESDSSMSREEVSALVDAGTKEGVIHMKENRVIQNLIKLDRISVSDVMTPRVVVAIASENESIKEFYAHNEMRPFSRIPLYSVDKDTITGYVLVKDVLERLAEDKFDTTLDQIKRPVMAIDEEESVSSAWEKLLASREHIAIVVNEYGSFEGIITMEDVVETILGLEIIDEKDTVIDMQQLAREKWQVRMAKYQKFKEQSSRPKEQNLL